MGSNNIRNYEGRSLLEKAQRAHKNGCFDRKRLAKLEEFLAKANLGGLTTGQAESAWPQKLALLREYRDTIERYGIGLRSYGMSVYPADENEFKDQYKIGYKFADAFGVVRRMQRYVRVLKESRKSVRDNYRKGVTNRKV